MRSFLVIAVTVLACLSAGCSDRPKDGNTGAKRSIVASDTIVSTMIGSLMPPVPYSVKAILPPGQCPGQYDVKLSDIERMKKASLVVSFKGMPYMDKAVPAHGAQLLVETNGRNWMAPESYMYGLGLLADRLSEAFPEDRDRIMRRKADAVGVVRLQAGLLKEKVERAGLSGKPAIVSSMQKEPIEWMGFRVVAEYGRPEAMSAREVVRLSGIGRDRRAILVVDNLQSGPDAGKGVAEALGAPHVTLTNFPSEKGYLATLEENVDAVLAAVRK